MAYIPTEWETGDVITAAKLNNMEQGIEDAFVAPEMDVYELEGTTTVDATFSPTGFVLDSGDGDEIPNHKIVRLTTNINFNGLMVVGKIYSFLSQHQPPVQGFSTYDRYVFEGIIRQSVGGSPKIFYVQVTYEIDQQDEKRWYTSMNELPQAAV